MYLLDTNVVSELRRARPNPVVVRWLERVPASSLHVSVVTIGEIQAGVENKRAQDPAKALEIEEWLHEVMGTFGVVNADAAAFREWARLMHRQSDNLLKDALIAATALVNSLTVVTRNVRDFQQLRMQVINPFDNTA